jgi:hypothetical protein
VQQRACNLLHDALDGAYLRLVELGERLLDVGLRSGEESGTNES